MFMSPRSPPSSASRGSGGTRDHVRKTEKRLVPVSSGRSHEEDPLPSHPYRTISTRDFRASASSSESGDSRDSRESADEEVADAPPTRHASTCDRFFSPSVRRLKGKRKTPTRLNCVLAALVGVLVVGVLLIFVAGAVRIFSHARLHGGGGVPEDGDDGTKPKLVDVGVQTDELLGGLPRSFLAGLPRSTSTGGSVRGTVGAARHGEEDNLAARHGEEDNVSHNLGAQDMLVRSGRRADSVVVSGGHWARERGPLGGG